MREAVLFNNPRVAGRWVPVMRHAPATRIPGRLPLPERATATPINNSEVISFITSDLYSEPIGALRPSVAPATLHRYCESDLPDRMRPGAVMARDNEAAEVRTDWDEAEGVLASELCRRPERGIT